MVATNLIMHFHHTLDLWDFRIRSIGQGGPYFDTHQSGEKFKVAAHRIYWPVARTLASLVKKSRGKFKVSLSLSGSFIDLCLEHDPLLIDFIKEMLAFSQVDILCQTSQHGLISVASPEDFQCQATEFRERVRRIFGRDASVFHNAGLIYSDYIGRLLSEMGFRGCLIEGWEPIVPPGLGVHHLFHHRDNWDFKLLPRSANFSNDIARRFASSDVRSHVLNGEKYFSFFEKAVNTTDDLVNVFIDLFAMASHPNSGAGFCEFLEDWAARMLNDERFSFVTSSEAVSTPFSRGWISTTSPVSMSERGHDVARWLGNNLQQDISDRLVALREQIKQAQSPSIEADWQRLFCLHQFAQMSIKFFDSEQDVSAAHSPYDVYLRLANILEDLSLRCQKRLEEIERGEGAEQPVQQQAVRPVELRVH